MDLATFILGFVSGGLLMFIIAAMFAAGGRDE